MTVEQARIKLNLLRLRGEIMALRCGFTLEEIRYNENHDPKTGRFTSGKGVDISGESGIIKAKLSVDLQFFAEKDIEKQESNSLKRAIRNYEKQIKQHKEYINNPYEHCPEWDSFDERKKNGLIRHWKKEISNFEESVANRVDELKKRGDYNE